MISSLSSSTKKLMVIGLDGVPFTFLQKEFDQGNLPYLKKLVQGGSCKQINSALPYVSSVAWSSYMTGEDASGHNIYGFIDRNPNPFDLYCPSAINLKSETLWQALSRRGKRVIVINVPVSYPPQPVNGTLIAGFLCPSLDEVAYPRNVSAQLKEMDYRIDADVDLAHRDKSRFLQNVYYTLEKRFEAAAWLSKSNEWDFFQLHIMETDRMNHFFWKGYEQQDTQEYQHFLDFYNHLDYCLGEFIEECGSDSDLLILSDHGFCTLQREVNLNVWLRNEGYLVFKQSLDEKFETMDSQTKAYHFYPGRIFLNINGREEMGSISTENEYNALRSEITDKLLELKDPETHLPVVKTVYKREELYSGAFSENAADLLAIPYDGYDLKGNLNQNELFSINGLEGMHTYEDAFVLSRGSIAIEEVHEIKDLFKVITSHYL